MIWRIGTPTDVDIGEDLDKDYLMSHAEHCRQVKKEEEWSLKTDI